MKKIISVAVVGMFLTTSAGLAIAGSKVDGKITNKADIEKAINASIGANSTANMGSISMKNTTVGKSGVITNDANISKAINASIGKGSTSSMGSVDLE